MPRMMFVNLPVADLDRAKAFYSALGATIEPKVTDATAACMVFSETIFVMLLTHDKFRQFTPKAIAAARTTGELLLCFLADRRDEVNALAATAAKAGGRADPAAPQDYGFMFSRSIEDHDGHIWETMWMDSAAAEQGAAAIEAA